MLTHYFDSFMYGIIYMPFIRILWILIIWVALARLAEEHQKHVNVIGLSIIGIILLIWAYAWPVGASDSLMHSLFYTILGQQLFTLLPTILFALLGIIFLYGAFLHIVSDSDSIEDDYEI